MKPVVMVTLASVVVVSMIIARPSTTASLARAASSSATPLTIEQLIDIRHPSNPMWSPDGRHVVFVWDRAGVSKVYVADVPAAQETAPAPRELAAAGSQLAGAFWTSDGALMELNPRPVDITVTRPIGESLTGRDSQLDAAVRELLKQIEQR